MLRHGCIITGTSCSAEGRLLSGGRTDGGRIIEPDDMIPIPCHTFDGAVVLVPGAVYDAIGPLDESYRHALAAADYGVRARKAGFPRMVAAGITGTASRILPRSDARELFRFNRRSHGVIYAVRHHIRNLFRKQNV